MSLDSVSVTGDRASVVVRGFSPPDLKRRAARDCGHVFGRDEAWKFTREEIVPCLVSIGGRVRLYEGRFEACRSSVASAAR
jgi:hypothetical protein